MTSTALGGALLAAAVGAPALADDECGAHAPGVTVVCTAEGGPYDRVTYRAATDLNLVLEDGAVLIGGIFAATAGDHLTITGRDAVIRSDESTSLFVHFSSDAAVNIDVGDIEFSGSTYHALDVAFVRSADISVGDIVSTARGAFVHAVENASLSFGDARAQGGDYEGRTSAVTVVSESARASVNGGSVQGVGDRMGGVTAQGQDVLVSLQAVTTEGDEADGLVIAARRSAEANVGAVTTLGAGSHGVRLEGEGSVTLALGDIVTHGDDAHGVSTESGSRLSLIEGHVGSVTTYGEQAQGMYLYADNIDLSGGVIATAGDYANGAFLNAYETANLAFDAVTTQGYGATGISGWAGQAFSLAVDRVSTQGDAAMGVDLWGDGDIAVRLDEVVTRGESAGAVRLESQGAGELSVEAERIDTRGDYSTGVLVLANGQRTAVDVGAVTTGSREAEAAVTGHHAHGIEVLDAGYTAVSASSVRTHGDDADGIRLVTLPLADVALEAGAVETAGDRSRGVNVDMSEPGRANVSVETVATRGLYADGVRLRNAATASVDVGDVQTQGEQAHGLSLEVRDAAAVAGSSISTMGHGSDSVRVTGTALLDLELGTVATAGDRAAAVRAEGVVIRGDIAEASTAGYESHGVEATAGDDIDLRLGRVRTSGGDAVGVRLTADSGDIQTEIVDVETSGGGAHGVVLSAHRDVDARIGRIAVQQAGAHGLVATSGGAQTIAVAQGVTSQSGVAVDLSGSEVSFVLGEGGVVSGGTAGVRIDAWNGSSLTLRGGVSSSDGLALDIKGGATVIDNLSGRLEGRIDLTANDDTFNNGGRFTARGVSDFGGGQDVFNNTGRIDLSAGAAPQTATFAGLERLNNSGVIHLANGVAGDVLTISGVLEGRAGNRIDLDLDLRGAAPVSDRIVAGGFDGLNHIHLHVQGRAALGDTGVVVARSAMAQTGAEIDVTVAQGGFVDYSLVFDDGEYRLSGDLASPAFEPTKVASGAQHQWTSGADVVSARFDQLRDDGRRGARGGQAWVQVFNGFNDIDARRSFAVLGQTLDADLSHEVKSRGFQAGADRSVTGYGGDLALGLLSSAGTTELRFQNGDVTRYEGLGLGVYGHWTAGALSLGLLGKVDSFKLDYDWREANLKTRSDGSTRGVRLDAAWRLASGANWRVEPQAALSWSDTTLDRLSARDGAEVEFGDTTSLIGRIGVRASAEMTLGDGLVFRPYAAAHALKEFEGENVSFLLLADETVRVSDRATGAWGRAVLGATLDGPGGLGAFVQAERDLGEMSGFTARAGLKFAW